jgi:phosphatidylglycerophosphate synthase
VRRIGKLFPSLNLTPPGEEGGSDPSGRERAASVDFALVTDGSTLFDTRTLPLLAEKEGESVALIAPSQVTANGPSALLVSFRGRPSSFAGAARISSARIPALREGKGFTRELLEELADPPGGAVDLSAIDTYVREMRRHLPFLVMPIRSPADNGPAKRKLLDASQKKILDWPAWYIHRPLEKWIVYHICEWPLTPNQISFVNIAAAFLAVYLFASGRALPALALALAVGVLDGLDGKQARVKSMCSRGGDLLDHVSDKIYEFGWYIAIGYFLTARGDHGTTPLLLTAAILLSYLLDWPIASLSRKIFGSMLDDVGDFERRFRLVSGRRNTFMWTLLPFVLYDTFRGGHRGLYAGLWTLALYAAATLLVRLWRFFLHLSRHRTETP